MPSFFTTAAFAALATMASAQFSNSTGPAAVAVGGWTYAGCAVSSAATGSLIESSNFMTVERCLLDCNAYAYARISGADCFCASSTNGTTPVADAQCNKPCPGNSAEACGGTGAASRRRQAPGTVVSVYQRQQIVPAGNVYVTVINNIYVDYSPFDRALTTVTLYSTAIVIGCGCTNPVKPVVPVTTVVTTCAIGTNTASVVTLTVPTCVTPGTIAPGQSTVTAPVTTVVACNTCPGKSATLTVSPCPGCASTAAPTVPVVAPTTTAKAVFTGAASANKVGGGLLAGVVAVAALL